jgi:antitoxin component YwqK of YwqJK toxin-antitoxin module
MTAIFAHMKSVVFALYLICFGFVALAQKPGTIYPPGKAGIDYNLKNAKGQKEGLWIQQWASTRNMLYKGQYKNGLPTGIWERYHADGALMAIQNHIKDTTEVHTKTFYPDGTTLLSEGTYIFRKKDGEWKFYNKDGVLSSNENYSRDLLNGSAMYYYPNGKLYKKENYVQGIKEGPFEEYFDNGKKRTQTAYLKDAFHGAFTQWFPNGVKDCEGKYEGGKQHGQWMYFNESGSPKVTVLFNLGTETKRRYENGTFKEYYDSGLPKSEFNYTNGKLDGPFIEWYDKGEYVRKPATDPAMAKEGYMIQTLEGQVVLRQGDYVDGKLEGEVLYYKENGTFDRREVYEAGVLKSK